MLRNILRSAVGIQVSCLLTVHQRATRMVICRAASQSQYTEKCINQVTLLGRVGLEPQKRGTEDRPVIVFSLATNTYYRHQSGEVQQTVQWHRVCIFKPNLRETVYSYVQKGQRLLVQGMITYGDVQGQDGEKHTTTSIVADEVVFLGNKNPT